MTPSPAPTPPKVSVGTKFFYGFGSIAYGVKDIAFRSYLLLFYNQVVGLPATIVSAAIMVALVLDAVSDPIVGHWSDRLRSKWGRRHPFMYASALPVAASFLLLWTPPSGWSNEATFVYLVVVAVAVRTFITAYEIPSSALAPELTDKYDERTAIASYRYFFGYLGGLGMSFAMLYVFLRPTAEHPVGQLNPDGYWNFAIVGAVIMFVSILVSSFGTHGRIKYLRELPPPVKSSASVSLREVRESFGHAGFLGILAFGVLKYTAIGMTAALSLYFGTYFWEFESKQLAVLALDGIAAAAVATVFAPFAGRLLGKRNAAFLLAVVAVLVAVAPFALRFSGLMFPNGDPRLLWSLFGLQAIYGLCGISSAILVHAMIGDIVDDSALRTGRRAEGLFYAANSFMQKCVSGLGVLLAGLLLAHVSFPVGAKPGEIDPAIPANLALWYMPTLVALYIVGACFLYFYRIDRSQHEANIAQLRQQEVLPD